MSPKSLQLEARCPFPDISSLSNSTPASFSTNVVGDFISGINSQFYNYKKSFDKKKSIFDQWSSKEFIYNIWRLLSCVSRPDSGR